MTNVNDIRRSVTTSPPALALVGATQLVVETVRSARESPVVQDAVQQVVHQVPTRVMDVAQRASQDLRAQGRVTLSRGCAAVATVRRAVVGGDRPQTPVPGTAAAPTAAEPAAEALAAQPPARKRAPARPTGTAKAAKPAAKPARARAKVPGAAGPATVAPVGSAGEPTAGPTAEVTRAIHEAAQKAGD